jgi:ATP-dependent Clp protease ATP-binding subunit ClpA
MFDRLTDRARKVLGLSRQECQRFNHDYIGTEHILLALLVEGSGVAADVLKNLDVDPRKIRKEVERLITPGASAATMGQIPFTPGARKVLELALEESNSLGHNYIGTEHLFLGLIREEKGIAAQVLRKLNIRLESVLAHVHELLGMGEAPAEGQSVGDSLTGRARRAMNLARAEAERFRHDRIGTEHILLGLVWEETTIGGELSNLLLRGVLAEAEKRMTPGTEPVAQGRLPLTPAAMTVMELASQEARDLGHERVGTGHLLVGLIREKEGIAAKVLSEAGIRLEDALADVRKRPGTAAVDEQPAPARPLVSSVFDRFADRSRTVLGLARQEAQRFNHDYIGTEHVLLGLIAEGGGAADVLGKLGIDPKRVRADTERRLTPGKTMVTKGQLPFTPALKHVLELTLEEATALGHDAIRLEHLLLGLIREGRGTAAQVLASLGATVDAVRKALGPPAPPE